MITASRLAGFFAAHAIWCVSDGDALIPMLAYTSDDGKRNLDRFASNDLQSAVAAGKQKLESNEMNATDAALLYDGRIALEAGKLDAILIEMRAYFSPCSSAIIAVPYTPKSAGRFLVHKPKILSWCQCEDFEMGAAFTEFYAGVGEHDKGAKIWNDALDESR